MYKVGQEVYYEFELHTIRDIADERVTFLSDKAFTTKGYDLTSHIFPVSQKIADLSEFVQSIYTELDPICRHRFSRRNIHDHLIKQWELLCNLEDEKEVSLKKQKLTDFKNRVLTEYKRLSYLEIHGVKLF